MGTGDNRRKVPARVEVIARWTGGRSASTGCRTRARCPTSRATDNGKVLITPQPAKGPLIFDLGICLVLVSLPTLPGAPPPGSWIDQAIVQWVLIALVTAMTLYIVAWIRQGD
ncbi:hypothetical protein BST14_18350 [Mycobacterium arosiense ATCC BAA-1401 = DSM 45069]|uniref:Uncharacterized protein n=1 Tax=Mycobacterium arosiense ATCC BAA-1401 = DSM 45069 TaxID=1265311 RepID=A0A1W9ZBT5_MYCAI|nr:hypothetical protein BST14_18350 [Mycobacterium arosiense ATCC BAA-1401 = DSM 45069]